MRDGEDTRVLEASADGGLDGFVGREIDGGGRFVGAKVGNEDVGLLFALTGRPQ